MNGIQYEKACVRYLSHHGYHNIELTPATGDQGIDIIAYRRRKKYGFQCKYYTRSVGNDAVQQAYAGMKYYECDHCGVITNSVFTPAAVRLADKTDVILMEEITPAFIYLPSALISVSCFVLACASLGEIATFAVSASTYANLHIFHALTMLIGSILTAFGERRYYVMLTAVVFLFLSLLSAAVLLSQTPAASFVMTVTFSFIISVYASIHLISLIRIRTANMTAMMRSELKEEMKKTLTETGLHFGALLERDLHASLRLKSSENTGDQMNEFIYECDCDISENLPVLEALLNHTAVQQNLEDRYMLEWLGNGLLKAVIVSVNEEE